MRRILLSTLCLALLAFESALPPLAIAQQAAGNAVAQEAAREAARIQLRREQEAQANARLNANRGGGCPPGFTDDGLHCRKPKPITRSAYPWKFGDALNLDMATERCRQKHGDNCTKIGEIIYSTCPTNYKAAPAPATLCTPICPTGMVDMGVSCRKNAGGRARL